MFIAALFHTQSDIVLVYKHMPAAQSGGLDASYVLSLSPLDHSQLCRVCLIELWPLVMLLLILEISD